MKIENILNCVISNTLNHVQIPCDYFEIFILKNEIFQQKCKKNDKLKI
jgi:hypothetical protein